MYIVRDIINGKKQKEVWSVEPKSTVLEALKKLKEKEIGALMVIDNKGKVAGIFSERDYARKITLKGKSARETMVKEIMTPAKRMFTVNPDTSIEDCMALMTEKHIRHLPVFDKDKFVGVISIGDLVKSIISAKEDVINHLTDYIGGKFV